MKTIVITLVLALAGISLNAKKNPSFKYFITKEDTVICKKLNYGLVNTTYKLHNGERNKISNREVLKFSINGRIYEKMPVFEGNQPTGEVKLMELIMYSRGLGVYKYVFSNSELESLQTKIFVYKADKFMLCVNDNNRESICNFLAFK